MESASNSFFFSFFFFLVIGRVVKTQSNSERQLLNRIRKTSVGKRKPQATSRHLYGTWRAMWPPSQIPTSTFSTRVTLGQFLDCSGLPFSHLLTGKHAVTLALLISSMRGWNENTVYQGLRIVHSSIRRSGSYYWIFNLSLLKWTLSGP